MKATLSEILKLHQEVKTNA